MKKIDDIIQGVNKDLNERATKSEKTLNEEATELVNQLFKILITQVSYFAFKSQDDNYMSFIKREWVKTFIANNMDNEKIKRGIEKIRKAQDEIKNITPIQFVGLCMIDPSDIGAPETRKAYLEACRLSHPCETVKNWSHVVVRYAAQKTGSHFLRTEPESKTYPVFEQNYREACEMFADGRIMQTLEHDDGTKEYNTEMEKQRAVILDSYKDIKSASQALKMMRNLL